jgi:hypothetical protein
MIMRPLDFTSHTPRWPLILLLLVAALGTWLGWTWRAQERTRAHISALEAQVRERQAAGLRPATAAMPTAPDRLDVPLRRIESAWRDDIALLRLDADVSNARIGLSLRARSQGALWGFVSRLRKTGATVRLISQETPSGDANGEVNVSLEVRA